MQTSAPSGVSAALEAGLAVVLAAVATAVLVFVASSNPNTANPDAQVVLLTTALIALCLFPGIHWYFGSRRSVPVFEAICLSHIAHYGLTGLLLPNQFRAVTGFSLFSAADLAGALATVTVGCLVMVVVYYAFASSPWARRLPGLDLRLDRARLSIYLPIAIFGGVALAFGRLYASVGGGSESGLAAILNVLDNQLYVAIALLCYLSLPDSRRHGREVLLLGSATVLGVIIGLSTSMLEMVFIVPLMVGMIGLQVRKTTVIVVLVAMAVSYLVILQPIKLDYRKRVQDAQVSLTLQDSLSLWYAVTLDYFNGTLASTARDTSALDTSLNTLQRMDFIHILAQVQQLTPSDVPYYNGSTYSYFITGWVPRMFWANKPGALDANIDMILTYGLMTAEGLQTTMMSIGMLPEAYANAGQSGVLVFMGLQGIVLAACTRVFSARRSIGAQAVYLSVVIYFLNGVGSATTMVYGGLVQNLIANALILWLAAGSSSPLWAWLGESWRAARSAEAAPASARS